MTRARAEQEPVRWNFTAAIAAWIFPGLGHVLLGHVRRGAILAVTIGLLWVAGLLIGGISVIDRHHHPIWFLGQMLVAPSLAVEAGHRHLINQYGTPMPGEDPIYQPSFGRVHEQGTLYVALAGLLNLLAILDVLYRDPDDPRDRPNRSEQGDSKLADDLDGARP